MPFSDLSSIFQWWLIIFIIGIAFLPLTSILFKIFLDKGYIFSKIIGIALVSYVVFILGILKIQPFTQVSIFLVSGIFLLINVFLLVKVPPLSRWNLLKSWKIFIFEEIIFLLVLIFWSFIHAHAPDIHGLEKYMDFGFINSILRSEYFPPPDMWLTPFSINYYYFGHLVTAVLTKLSFLPALITYNLMLATISGFTFVGAFSIGANLTHSVILSKRSASKDSMGFFANTQNDKLKILLVGLLTAFLITFVGNLHTIYTFFKPYENEKPVPFWQLPFSFDTFPNAYWYPNATRFIENTIHEFPIYSFVVSDLHGHVLDIPFVLLTIAVLLSLLISNFKAQNPKQYQNSNEQITKTFLNFVNLNLLRISNFEFRILLLISFLLAIMYMTNAWDGIIYFLLVALVLLVIYIKQGHISNTEIKNEKIKVQNYSVKSKIFNFSLSFLIFRFSFYILLIGIFFFIFTLPFNLHFKPFASGIGVLCAPEFLTKIEKIGPFLFEKDHCQRSPLWQLLILYGFFYFWAISFIFFLFKKINPKHEARNPKQYQNTNDKNSKRIEHSVFENLNLFRVSSFEFRISPSDLFVLILIFISTFLIIIPEFIYIKDIYPAHYRANTMFKLVYQAFILLSISCGYIITRIIINGKWKMENGKFIYWKFAYLFIGIIGLFVVFIYPYFAINSYFGELKTYHGLDGIKYLKSSYPTDYEAILWINKNVKDQPVILEAQGDSYTDYARVSANTGLPTVLGWPVHEWLWRGNYDIDNPPADPSKIYDRPAPRIEEITTLYESQDSEETKRLLEKYKIELVFIGDLERQKYPNLNEQKFKELGNMIFEKGETRIYKIDLSSL